MMVRFRRPTPPEKFYQVEVEDDDWSEWIHPLPGYMTQCCDCGLVHHWEFKIVPSNDRDVLFNPGEDRDRVIVIRAIRHDTEYELMLRKMDEALLAMQSTPGLIPHRWMVSPQAYQIISGKGQRRPSYRGIKFEEHDEWAWGWMLRSSDGRFVEVESEGPLDRAPSVAGGGEEAGVIRGDGTDTPAAKSFAPPKEIRHDIEDY